MKHVSTLLALTVAALPTVATAVEFTGGSAGLSFARLTYDDSEFTGDVTSTTFEGKGGIAFSEQFGADFVAVVASGTDNWDDGEGTGESDVGAQLFGIRPYYNLAPGAKVGLYYDSLSMSYEDFTLDGTTYGIEASFAAGPTVDVAAYYGQSQSDDLDAIFEELGSTVDITNLGLMATVAVTPDVDIGAFVQRDKWTVDGEFSGDATATETGLRAEWNLAEMTGTPIIAHIEASRIAYDFEGETWDDTRVEVGATFLFGPSGEAPDAFLGNHMAGHGFLSF